MELAQSLNTSKRMVVFLKTLNKEAFSLFSPYQRVPQIPFAHCYKLKQVKITLFEDRTENKVIILDKLISGEYLLKDFISKI